MTEEVIPDDNTLNNPASPNVASTETPPVDDNKPDDSSQPEPVDAKPKVIPKWFNDRFSEMTSQKRTLEKTNETLIEQNAQLLAQLAAAKKGIVVDVPSANNTQNDPAVPPPDIDRMVNERAMQIAEAKRFNEECDRIAEQGNKEFIDFADAINTLHQIGLIEPADKPQTFLDVATTLNNPHKVIHYLGKNPDEAARLRALPPIRLAQEMARLEMKISQPKNVAISNAPAPIKPINGSAKSDVDLLNAKDMPMDQWVQARRKQREIKRSTRN